MTAAADAYRVPEDFIDRPSHAHVEETTPGTFRIRNSQARDAQGDVLPDKALCTYDQQTNLWVVKLNTGEAMQVRHDDIGFVIVSG
jgi:hypothetical protein